MGDSSMQEGLSGIVTRLRKSIRIEVPIGYEDETGFHLGVNPAEEISRVAAALVLASNESLQAEQERESRIQKPSGIIC